MSKIKLDLHDVFNDGSRIEAGLENAFAQALDKRIALLEIIPGKGSGQLNPEFAMENGIRQKIQAFFLHKKVCAYATVCPSLFCSKKYPSFSSLFSFPLQNQG